MSGLAVGLVVASAALSGCAITADQTEITNLSTAATEFKAAASGGAPATAAQVDAAKARLIEFVASGQIPPAQACTDPTSAERAFENDIAKYKQDASKLGPGAAKTDPKVTADATAAAASWHALLNAPGCGWGIELEPDAPGAPPAQPAVTALETYYAGVADIASATSVQQVVDATNKATAAATTLASFAPGAAAPAKAASALVGKLVQYGLQTAQYRALEAVLGDVDASLDQASGPIVSELRVQQGYWIDETAFFARDGVSSLHDAFAAGGTPADRLALLQLAQPILDDLSTQQKAVRADPGAAYQKLVTAHHALYAALKSHKGQVAGALAAAEDIAGSAQSLAGAVAPGAPAKATAAPAAKTASAH